MGAKKFTVDRASLFELTMEELRKQAKRVFETANRRARNIKFYSQNRGAVSPAYDRLMESGGLFSKRGKSQRELIRELNRAYAFLNSDDGATVASAMAYGRRIRDMTSELTETESSLLYAAYREVEKKYPAFIGRKGSKGEWINSDLILDNIRRQIQDARYKVYGGLAGDLFSREKREQVLSLENRKEIIESLVEETSHKIEGWVNSQLTGEGLMKPAERTFKLKLDDVVPNMRNPSITLTTGTKVGKGGDGIIRFPKGK